MTDDNPPSEQPSLPAHPDPAPWPHAVQSQLNRLLVQPHFVAHEGHARLLRRLVEQALADPQAGFPPDETDTKKELREILKAYYGDKGRNDPVLFALPDDGDSGLTISANDIRLDQDEIDDDAEQSAVLPKNRPINIHAIIAMLIMTLAGGAYFFGIDRMTEGPTGPESITDVGPLNQRLHSVAVLPFETAATNPANGFFAQGIAGELTARLGRTGTLRLIAPETMKRIDSRSRSLKDIAKAVDVRYVLRGNLSRTRNTLELDIDLMQPESGDTLWRHRYERKLENIAALYADIGNAVAATLNKHANREAKKTETPSHPPLDDAITVRPGAYVTYLKARTAASKNRPASLAQSITLFQASINADPALPRAHSGLGAAMTALAGYGFERIAPRPSLAMAKRAVIDAMRLNEFYPEPYAYLGMIRTVDEWDWKGAERAYVYAIQFNPSYADARLLYSRFLEALGRHRDAIDQADRAHTLNPGSPVAHANRAWQYLQAGWFKRAREQFNALRKTHPHAWIGHWGIAQYHWRRGDLDDAIESLEQAVKSENGNTLPLASLGHLYAITGQKQKALDVLQRIQMIGRTRYVSPVHIAIIHAGFGDHDQALHWLEKAVTVHAYGLPWVNVTKEFDSLHNLPRYHAILKRLKLYSTRSKKQSKPE